MDCLKAAAAWSKWVKKIFFPLFGYGRVRPTTSVATGRRFNPFREGWNFNFEQFLKYPIFKKTNQWYIDGSSSPAYFKCQAHSYSPPAWRFWNYV
jgi:hypothetical protein